MFIVSNYVLAVVLCFVTMLCWGSWGNTQKLAAKSWRFEHFYWDYVLGTVIFSLIFAFTFGSIGDQGRSFLVDMGQMSSRSFWLAFAAGIVFNLSNILLCAATSIAGLSVSWPLGLGIALVVGAAANYIIAPKANPILFFLGCILIVVAIVCNSIASKKHQQGKLSKEDARKGTILAVVAGFLMSTFYPIVALVMDVNNFVSPEVGKITPYTALFIFSLGTLASNFIFNTYVMKRPFVGTPVSYSEYFKGSFSTHLVGILGGAIWGLGTGLSWVSSGEAGPAISYALGQGSPMIAAIWGVFIWKEFKGAKGNIGLLLGMMFVLFFAGLGCIIASGN